MLSLQDTYAPNNKCFGCGPKNSKGLRLKSIVHTDNVIAWFEPEEHHQAFENVLAGGICGTLLDCHSNWCAAYSIMIKRGENIAPCTVTARYTVNLLLPTPMDKKLKIIATPKLVTEKKAEIIAELYADDQCTAKCEGIFVAVNPGHPGYHRW